MTTTPDPTIARRASRSDRVDKQSLDDQVIGAVRRRREQRAANQAAEEGVGRGERKMKIEEAELAGGAAPSTRRDLRRPPGALR